MVRIRFPPAVSQVRTAIGPPEFPPNFAEADGPVRLELRDRADHPVGQGGEIATDVQGSPDVHRSAAGATPAGVNTSSYQCETISYSAMRFGSIFALSNSTSGISSPRSMPRAVKSSSTTNTGIL